MFGFSKSKTFNQEEARQKVEEYLLNKYNKTFVFEKVVIDNNFGLTYGFLFHEHNNPSAQFSVRVKNNLKIVEDSYINLILGYKYNEVLKKMVKEQFNCDIWTETLLYSPQNVQRNHKRMEDVDIISFLKKEKSTSFIFEIFISSPKPIDKELETVKINNLIKEIYRTGAKNISINLFYVKPEVFNKLDKEYYDIFMNFKYGTDGFYSSKEMSVGYVYMYSTRTSRSRHFTSEELFQPLYSLDELEHY